jgi:hypothetical protein
MERKICGNGNILVPRDVEFSLLGKVNILYLPPVSGSHLFINTKPVYAVLEQCRVILMVLRNKFNA